MQQLSVADVLSRAADLIEPEGAWTQGTLGRDALGNKEMVTDAVCWCASGAILKVLSGTHLSPLNPWAALERCIGGVPIPHWNDAPERQQSEVVAALRAAAELAKASS